MQSEEKYVFVAEWFDTQAQIIRNYYLSFFANDNTVELVRFCDGFRSSDTNSLSLAVDSLFCSLCSA